MKSQVNFRIIIDTNILVALIDKKDKWHKKALMIREALKNDNAEFVFLDCVINETITVIGRRLEEKGLTENFHDTISSLERLISKEKITWISQETNRLYQNILELTKKYKGKLNFHDALIALVSRELDIKYIATFDTDFEDIDWLTIYNMSEMNNKVNITSRVIK